jgi:hypothetical protein
MLTMGMAKALGPDQEGQELAALDDFFLLPLA